MNPWHIYLDKSLTEKRKKKKNKKQKNKTKQDKNGKKKQDKARQKWKTKKARQSKTKMERELLNVMDLCGYTNGKQKKKSVRVKLGRVRGRDEFSEG